MKIVNKGIEIGLNGVIIDNKDWTWSLGANFSAIKNEVKNLPMTSITTGKPSGPGYRRIYLASHQKRISHRYILGI